MRGQVLERCEAGADHAHLLDRGQRAVTIERGDLGLRKAVAAFYGDGPLPSIEEVRVIGTRFAPFQNLTAHYLLADLYLST